MTEDKFKEAEILRISLKRYETVKRALDLEEYVAWVGFSGPSDVSANAVRDFLGEDWPALRTTIETLTRAAFEVRRNKLQAEFDKL